jgi:membrane fusion protein (multidrug efflux system)
MDTANFKETHCNIQSEVSMKAVADAESGKVCWSNNVSVPASGALFSLLPPDNATGNFVKIEQRILVKIKN